MRQKRQKQPKSARPRIYLLDELRGFAILCMVVHHAFLDVGVSIVISIEILKSYGFTILVVLNDYDSTQNRCLVKS